MNEQMEQILMKLAEFEVNLSLINNRLDWLEEPRRKEVEAEYGEGTPVWVKSWLEQAERDGTIGDILSTAKEMYE